MTSVIRAKDIFGSRDKKPREITLCMIAKDAKSDIRTALLSAKPYCTRMVVGVDSKTVDDTKRIALECGAEVIDITWDGDYSSARNKVLAEATSEWILVLDTDEDLEIPGGVDDLNRILDIADSANPREDLWFLESFTLMKEKTFDPNAQMVNTPRGRCARSHIPRLFRRYYMGSRPTFTYVNFPTPVLTQYSGCIHEQLPEELCRRSNLVVGIKVWHYGYLKPDNAAKQEVYWEMAKAWVNREPQSFYAWFALLQEALKSAKWETCYRAAVKCLALKKDAPPFAYIAGSLALQEMGRMTDALAFILRAPSADFRVWAALRSMVWGPSDTPPPLEERPNVEESVH